MRTFDGIAAAADAARRFFIKNEDELPAHVQDRLEPLTRQGSSPVDLIVAFTKAAFANRADTLDDKKKVVSKAVPKEMMEIAAGLANIIDADGYHNRLDGRATGIAIALRRDSGERVSGITWPAPKDDPEPDKEFAAPTPAPTEETAAGAGA